MIAISDVVWQAIIAGVVTLVGSVISVWAGRKLNDIQKTGQAIHKLTNNAMGVQLRLNKELSNWKANQTGLPEHQEAAELAEKLYNEHESQQAKVDAQPGPPAK